MRVTLFGMDVAHQTGIGTYAKELRAGLTRQGARVSWVAFRKMELRLGGRGYGGNTALQLQRALRPLPRADVRHATDLYVLHRRCNAMTLHDLSWQQRPQDHVSHNLLWRRHEAQVRALPLVLTDAETVRLEVVAQLGLAESQVVGVHLAPDHSLFRPEPHDHRADPGAASWSLQAGPEASARRPSMPYALVAGELRSRKRSAEVLEAMLDPRLAGLHLVRVGPPIPDTPYGLQCKALIARLGGRFLDLGYQPRAALRELYARATALVYPSEYEGFGLPPLEAAACGTPSVLTDLPLFRETMGADGHFMHGLDALAVADALVEARDQPVPAARLVARAAGYTWDRCARETLAAYRSHVL